MVHDLSRWLVREVIITIYLIIRLWVRIFLRRLWLRFRLDGHLHVLNTLDNNLGLIYQTSLLMVTFRISVNNHYLHLFDRVMLYLIIINLVIDFQRVYMVSLQKSRLYFRRRRMIIPKKVVVINNSWGLHYRILVPQIVG